MRCTATLTTLTPTDDVHAIATYGDVGGGWVEVFMGYLIPDGVTVTRRGDRLLRDDVTLVTCNRKRPHHETLGHGPQHWHKPTGEEPYFAEWSDGTEGATPHVDPMDELVAASEEAGLYDDPDRSEECRRMCAPRDGIGMLMWQDVDGDFHHCPHDDPNPCPDLSHFWTRTGGVPCPSCGDSGTAPTDGCDGTDCRIPAAHTAPTVTDEGRKAAYEAFDHYMRGVTGVRMWELSDNDPDVKPAIDAALEAAADDRDMAVNAQAAAIVHHLHDPDIAPEDLTQEDVDTVVRYAARIMEMTAATRTRPTVTVTCEHDRFPENCMVCGPENDTADMLDAAVGECYRFLDPLTRERMPSEDIAEMLLAAWGAAARAREENS